MKRFKNPYRSSIPPSLPAPALNVVVYRNPGPNDAAIENYSRVIADRGPVSRPGGALGYITFVESDFDRLWKGVESGDVLGTAYSVLHQLGPGVRHLIERSDDFIFGWMGGTDNRYGDILLLQIFPRAHLQTVMN